jgi:hypothetical protein
MVSTYEYMASEVGVMLAQVTEETGHMKKQQNFS